MYLFSNKYALFDFQTPFLPKKNPRRACRRPSTRGLKLSFHLPQPSGRAHGSDPFLFHFFEKHLKCFRIIWDVSGGSLEVLRSNFCQLFDFSRMVQKVSWCSVLSKQTKQTPPYIYIYVCINTYTYTYIYLYTYTYTYMNKS